MGKRAVARLGCLVLAVAWWWCAAPTPAQAAGLLYRLPYQWIDDNARPLLLSKFRGKPTVITMGFGACQRICSTTPASMPAAMPPIAGACWPIRLAMIAVSRRRWQRRICWTDRARQASNAGYSRPPMPACGASVISAFFASKPVRFGPTWRTGSMRQLPHSSELTESRH